MNNALLMTMMNPPADGDAEFNDWANTEHLPERRTIPGIRTAIRFRNKAESPRYMAIYDLDDISVLKSKDYTAIAGENLSPWSKRILAGATARWRFEGSSISQGKRDSWTGGAGTINELLLVIWLGVAGRCDEAVTSALEASVSSSLGLMQWRAFASERDGRTDYVGIVESSHPIDIGVADRARYSLASHLCDSTHIFTLI